MNKKEIEKAAKENLVPLLIFASLCIAFAAAAFLFAFPSGSVAAIAFTVCALVLFLFGFGITVRDACCTLSPQHEEIRKKYLRIYILITAVTGITVIAMMLYGITNGDFSSIFEAINISPRNFALGCLIVVALVFLGLGINRLSEGDRLKGSVFLIIGIVAIIIACVTIMNTASPTDEDSFGHDWAVAMTVAEDAVKSKLKSPSTAKFSPKNETTITRDGDIWIVSGWVDAKNSYNATIRNNYSVKFTFTSYSDYTISYCTLN